VLYDVYGHVSYMFPLSLNSRGVSHGNSPKISARFFCILSAIALNDPMFSLLELRVIVTMLCLS